MQVSIIARKQKEKYSNFRKYKTKKSNSLDIELILILQYTLRLQIKVGKSETITYKIIIIYNIICMIQSAINRTNYFLLSTSK